jgi:hypothetical protein
MLDPTTETTLVASLSPGARLKMEVSGEGDGDTYATGLMIGVEGEAPALLSDPLKLDSFTGPWKFVATWYEGYDEFLALPPGAKGEVTCPLAVEGPGIFNISNLSGGFERNGYHEAARNFDIVVERGDGTSRTLIGPRRRVWNEFLGKFVLKPGARVRLNYATPSNSYFVFGQIAYRMAVGLAD